MMICTDRGWYDEVGFYPMMCPGSYAQENDGGNSVATGSFPRGHDPFDMAV